MNKNNQKTATHRIFATLLAKNTKKCLHFALALAILALFLPICTLSYTNSLPKPQILSAYAQNSTTTSDEFPAENFTAFVTSTICFKVYSQYEIECTNADGLSVSMSTISTDFYLVSVSSDTPITSQIIVKNRFGGVAFSNFSFVASEIESIDFVPRQAKFNALGDNFLQVCYNDNLQLIYNGDLSSELRIGDAPATSLYASDIIKSINSHMVVLNFESVDYTQYDGADFVVSAENTTASIALEIDNLPLTSTFVLEKTTIDYFTSSETITANALIDANTFATFALNANSFAQITDIEKIESGESFDTYKLTVDISNISASTEIVITAQTASGNIGRALSLVPTSSISKIVISASKTSLKSGEKVTFTAVLNNDEALSSEIDWYVNDQKVETGTQFEYARTQGGSFNVYAKLGETQSNSIALNVSYNNSELVVWYIVFAIALVILIGLIIFKRKKKTFISSMSLTDRARKFVPRYKTYINKYTRHQFFDLVYDIANLRDDVLFNFDETKDLCFEKISRELAGAHKIVRTIYKAPKEEKKALLESNLSSFETIMNSVIADLDDYAQKHPDQAIFNFKRKAKKG